MEFSKRLENWRNERNISPENCRPGVIKNVLEETVELLVADTEEDIIDALLDYIIYLENTYPIFNLNPQVLNPNDYLEKYEKEVIDAYLLNSSVNNFIGLKVGLSVELIKKAHIIAYDTHARHFNGTLKDKESLTLKTNDYKNEKLKTLGDNLILSAKAIITKLGYNYELCLNETIKEIDSRKGKWVDKEMKFVKEEVPSVPRYYANYKICKISK